LEDMHSKSKDDLAVGQKIRRYRCDAGLTQKEVATRIGVTGVQFHRYEIGATRVAASRLIAIASALNIRAETLLASASAVEARPMLAYLESSQEIVDLLQAFNSIDNPRNRSALLALARMMSSAPQQQAGEMLKASFLKLDA
jgi:transcriptional regulator with XRE-family HTH domain